MVVTLQHCNPNDKCCEDKDKLLKKCPSFIVEYITYNAPSNTLACKLNRTEAEIVFSIKGVDSQGGQEHCELLLIEGNAGTRFEQVEFADEVQPPNTPKYQSGYIRVYKTVNSRQTKQLKILVRKVSGAAQGPATITCKFRHSKIFGDTCTWQDPHTIGITVEVE